MAARKKRRTFGDLPPAYHFALNPYPELRFTSCPRCGARTGQRKRPLLMHIDPDLFLVLNYTNRYCKRCDMLIAHRHEIEHILTERFRPVAPGLIGNRYLIFATVERKAWREAMKGSATPGELRPHTRDFKSYEELRMTRGGWYRKDEEPPVWEPDPPKEWVKRRG